MGIFDPDEGISVYSLKQAIKNGVLVEVFKKQWSEWSGCKPIVATVNLFEEVSPAGVNLKTGRLSQNTLISKRLRTE